MKILILTALEYPHLGGVSTHITQLVNGLNKSGHEVDIISRTSLGKLQLIFMKLVAGISYVIGNKSNGYFLYHKLTGYFLYQKIKNKISSYDVVHLHSPSFVTSYLGDNSYIITCHADMVPEMIGQNKLKKQNVATTKFEEMEKKSYQKAKKIIAVDNRLKKFVQEITTDKDIVVMKNFIDVEQELDTKIKNQEEFKVLCPRRLVVKNGVEYAVRAFSLLGDNFKLLIAGNGEDEKKLKELVNKLGLKNVEFLGAKSPAEIKEIHKEVNAVVIPSITVNGLQEATSLSALEGFLYGVPVVASNIGGLSEMIINETNGFLFPEKDYVELATQIRKLSTDVALYEKIRINAYENLKNNFSVESRVKEIEKIYE
ncbi:MAG: glycosyltransferase family 4 protein [Bacteriovoracaceae bacterium]|nr:glycosyltransferase family 4 protein [Bacteriovoracaceae bacterium]